MIEIPPRVVNALRDDGIMIGRAGRVENVLKIRPPLVFSNEHAKPARRSGFSCPRPRDEALVEDLHPG